MQERRTTIRVPYACRVQYRPAEDLLARDGQLTDLSVRGAGLLTRGAHLPGERLTVHLPLPDSPDGMTATGVVRWSTPTHRATRSSRVGLEWLPLEETTRTRLHGFLARRPQPSPAPGAGRRRMFQMCGLAALLLGGGVLAVFMWSTARTLKAENDTLQQELAQRSLLIAQLHHKEQGLQQELTVVKAQFSDTTHEVARLDQHAQDLTQHMERLTQEVALVQEATIKAQHERDALMQQVLGLEQERLSLRRRLASLPELRLAIRETISARKAAQRAQRKRLLAAKRAAARLTAPIAGNRGYLIREGRPTIGRGTVWVRVHEPAVDTPVLAPAASSHSSP